MCNNTQYIIIRYNIESCHQRLKARLHQPDTSLCTPCILLLFFYSFTNPSMSEIILPCTPPTLPPPYPALPILHPPRPNELSYRPPGVPAAHERSQFINVFCADWTGCRYCSGLLCKGFSYFVSFSMSVMPMTF